MKCREYHPPHLYLDNIPYFITASTLEKEKLFDSDKKKEILKEILKVTIRKYNIKLHAWVILSNHYHILIEIHRGEHLYRFIKSLHGKSAIELNKLDNAIGRQVWYNYWDRCPRGEKDLYVFLNYIHINPIKHSYVKVKKDFLNLDDKEVIITQTNFPTLHTILKQYGFSSYNYYLSKYGEDGMEDIWRRYPIANYLADDF